MDATIPNPESLQRVIWSRDDRQSLLLSGAMWALIVLMIVPESFDYQSLLTGQPNSGGVISRLLWASLLAISVVIIVRRGSLAWLLLRTMNPFMFLFVALAVASIAWSIDPSLSARRLIRMATIVLACTAFVLIAWHAKRLQKVLRPILTIVLLASLAFGLVFPLYGIHPESAPELLGAWRGLANHKNGFGALASFALIFWFHSGLTREVKIWPAITGCAVAIACLLLSRSSTAIATSVVVMLLMLVFVKTPDHLRTLLPIFVTALTAVLLIYALAILNLIPGLNTLMSPIAAMIDKDLTFTGRTDIWAILTEHISYRPLLGTGYGAFWTAGPVAGTESYEFIWRMGGFYPGSAHNGYLEIVNDLGWVGLACFFGYVVYYIRQALQLMGVDRNQGALYLALFFQQAITNLSETHWFSVLSVDFVIMALATLALARGLLEQKLYAAFGVPHHATDVRVGNPSFAPSRSGG